MGYTFHLSGKIVSFPERKNKEPTEKSLQNLEKRHVNKKFNINKKAAAEIENSAAYMWIIKDKDFVHFGTVTFPVQIDERKANDIFKSFAKNIRRKHSVRAYIAVKEYHKSGNPHYHILFLAPFVKYTELNNTLNETFKNFGLPVSNNAFTTNSSSKRNVVTDISGCVKYVTKYITKSQKSDFAYKTKCYFISDSCRYGKKALNTLEFSFLNDNFPVKKSYAYEYVTILTYEPFPAPLEKML